MSCSRYMILRVGAPCETLAIEIIDIVRRSAIVHPYTCMLHCLFCIQKISMVTLAEAMWPSKPHWFPNLDV